MKLHEYQAKQLFRDYEISVPLGQVALSIDDVARAYTDVGVSDVVVKAQVHAGGRGKAGGIQKVTSADEATAFAQKLLGSRLVTHQTTAEGQPINAVYLEAASDIECEYYLALLLDRKFSKLCIMFSTEGGMDIEEVAEKTPDALLKFYIPFSPTVPAYVSRRIATLIGKTHEKPLRELLSKLAKLYIERDVSLLEINPLVQTTEGDLIPLDGKIELDDNAAYRQKDIEVDSSQDNPHEVEAAEIGISYIHLDGSIGCMVNGAGLAMATMDLIKLHGGDPANFLDVGGGASAEQIKQSFWLILKDKRVKSVLVNIFGGIMRCDIIAQGIIEATQSLKPDVPIIVRLAGTNVEKGKEMLDNSGLQLISASTLDEAAQLAVEKGAS